MKESTTVSPVLTTVPGGGVKMVVAEEPASGRIEAFETQVWFAA